MNQRIILHVDMDAFYAAIEQRDRPELRGLPVIVGGTPEGRGVVSTASYEARKFGIHSAMPAVRARRLCPDGVFLGGDIRKYIAVSRQVMEILRRHAEQIEQVSIDEAFLDVTDRAAKIAEGERVAIRIKREIREELRLTASVGVGPNEFLAKLGSDLRKPDGLVAIRPEEAERFLASLPVVKLWGVGPKTERRLQAAGFRTIGDVAQAPIDQLRRLLGAWGDVIYELACGIDERPVATSHETKSVSAENTFARDLFDIKEMRRALSDLSRELARRLRDDELRAKTIAIKVRFGDFRTLARQVTLTEATDSAQVIRAAAYRLLDEVERNARGVRLLGVRGSSVEHGVRQPSLFDVQVQRRTELERTVSYLRRRFGEGAVKWAREVRE
ncbi:MAG: DNA polymerase IV [Armatimonadota bacterium]|jgi:DNA polymerase-4